MNCIRFSFLWLASIVLLSYPPSARSENWPQFRGPTLQGISSEKDLPTAWSSSQNIAWKTRIAGVGWSSPVIWDQRIFLTATTEDGTSCRVLSLDRDSGSILWTTGVFTQKPTRKEARNSYATPTPVTDGKSIFAVFGEGGVACVDFDGKVLWTNTEHSYYSQHGLGASPILYKDVVFIPFDWSSPTGELRVGWQIPWDKSYVMALDQTTGKERFKAMRGTSRIGHITPQIVAVDGTPQLVSAAGDVIEGFNPDNGQRLWWVYSGGEAVVPSPVFGHGMVFNSSGFPTPVGTQPIHAAIRAFRLGGQGEVTKTNFVWEQTKAVPNIPSLLFANDLLFSIKENGMLMCLDPATGSEIYSHRMDGNYSASPVYADGKIYLLSDSGTTTVIDAGRTYREIAVNELGAGISLQASMAVSNGHIFVRTQDTLYCIGSK